MAAVTLKAQARGESTKGERKQLREQGKIPGVVYGKQIKQSSIAIDAKELLQLLRTAPRAIIDLEVPDQGTQPVIISEVQRDKVSRELLHIDFHQINMNEPISTTVRIDFVGEAAGVKEGGILQIVHHELDIRCLPQYMPDSLPVDISGLGIGESLLVEQLQAPEQIEIQSAPDEVLVTILMPQKEAEPDQADTEPAAKAEGSFEKKGAEAAETV